MELCEYARTCVIFNDALEGKPGIAAIYSSKYCEGDFKGCARYLVAQIKGSSSVPRRLLPNQWDAARKLIQSEP